MRSNRRIAIAGATLALAVLLGCWLIANGGSGGQLTASSLTTEDAITLVESVGIESGGSSPSVGAILHRDDPRVGLLLKVVGVSRDQLGHSDTFQPVSNRSSFRDYRFRFISACTPRWWDALPVRESDHLYRGDTESEPFLAIWRPAGSSGKLYLVKRGMANEFDKKVLRLMRTGAPCHPDWLFPAQFEIRIAATLKILPQPN